MVTVKWYEMSFDGEYAVNTGGTIVVYDADYNEVQRITNLTYRDAPHVSIEGGEWTNVSEIPTASDHMKADIEYLQMCMDYLMENGGTNE